MFFFFILPSSLLVFDVVFSLGVERGVFHNIWLWLHVKILYPVILMCWLTWDFIYIFLFRKLHPVIGFIVVSFSHLIRTCCSLGRTYINKFACFMWIQISLVKLVIRTLQCSDMIFFLINRISQIFVWLVYIIGNVFLQMRLFSLTWLQSINSSWVIGIG